MSKLIVLLSSNPATGSGGASRIINAYKDFLNRSGFEDFTKSTQSFSPSAFISFYFHSSSATHKIFRYLPYLSCYFLVLRLLFQSVTINRFRNRKIVFWWHSYGIIDAFLLVLISIPVRIFGKNISCTLHCPTFFDYPHALSSRLYFWLIHTSYANVHLLSHVYEPFFGHFSSSARKIIALNPLSNSQILSLGEYTALITSQFKNKVIFSMAQLIPSKGIHYVIKALSCLPDDWHLIIAGCGSDLQRLVGLTKTLNLSNRVSFVGFINDKQKDEIALRASVFCVPSCSDTQSIVNIEAISLGLPLVLFEYPVFRDLYGSLPSVYFSDAYDSSSLALSILSAYSTATEYHLKESKQLISKRFDDASLSRSYLNLLGFSHN